MCSNKDIRELLPAYLEQGLSKADQALVEGHVAACTECSAELALLRTIADDPVPDPGEAFWAGFPDRVHREVALQQAAAKARVPFRGIRAWFAPPRLALAASVLLAVGVAAWFAVRPAAPPPVTAAAQAEETAAYDDTLLPQPSAITELSSRELDSVDSWASNELAPLRQGVNDLYLNGPDGTIESSLAEMNKQELQQLSRMLDSQKEEISI